MIRGLRIVFFGVFLFSYSIKSPYYSPREEVKSDFASSFYIQNTDSTLIKEYHLIKKLYKKSEFSKALELGLNLQRISKEKEIVKVEIMITFLIGDIFRKTKNYKKSLFYYKNSYNLYYLHQKNKKTDLGRISFKENEYNFNDNIFRIAAIYQRIKKIDSAKYYYNKIININSLQKKFLIIKSNALSNLSNIYILPEGNFQDYEKAKKYALEAIKINKNLHNKIAEAASTASLANIYLELGENKKAEAYYLKALKLIKYNKDNKSIKFKEVFYDNLSWAMYQQKNYKAYDYLGMSYDIRDSLQNIDIQKILTEIEANHKVDILKRKVALKKLQESKKVLYLGFIGLVLLVVFGSILYYYKLRQKNLKLTLSENELEQQQNLEKLKTQTQVRILNAALDGKESERKQIAETLHDNVSALLSSANLHLLASKKQFKGDVPIEIDKTQAILLEASQKIRDLSHTLVSSILLKFGLSFALKDMASKYSNSTITIKTTCKNIDRYHQDFEIKVYNIIQELVNNILKHSKAKKASLFLTKKDDKLRIVIQDDGIGFDKDSVSTKDGLGINQIEARIQMLKGIFIIDSKKNNGTRITIEIPIVAREIINFD